ncbi:hypothetical protein [Streptomyces mirabilis]|uniref:hypothetical protein n=1 Tax=Streptomyces mirabilis TaxID=68239 RepID=UPI002E32E76E|nr:hypothetical protein [Streptomyces mirabilis]
MIEPLAMGEPDLLGFAVLVPVGFALLVPVGFALLVMIGFGRGEAALGDAAKAPAVPADSRATESAPAPIALAQRLRSVEFTCDS